MEIEVDTKKCKKFILKLDAFYRKNKKKLAHPVRARHFLQDFNYFINMLEDTRKIKRWKWTSDFVKENIFCYKKEDKGLNS